MLERVDKAPFPWFGGKSQAAETVWDALGDVAHYVEPFAGSLAVLLRRPHVCNRPYSSETINDADGLLINAWRGIQLSPEATAEAASWPVSEADLHARHLALVRWREEHELERLMGDPAWHDPVLAGWWLWGCSCWIGSGWCSGRGAWVLGADGRITRRDDGTREPGVARQKPHIGNNGHGVCHAGTREPGCGPDHEYHPMLMPELRRWFGWLAARLRHVRILNGDWTRAVTPSAMRTLSVRSGCACGVLLDPPYSGAVRDGGLYAVEDLDVSRPVREWAIAHGEEPDLRIVLAGFAAEHGAEMTAAGWREVRWYRDGWLRGGMALQGDGGTHQHEERLWLSPHCLSGSGSRPRQEELFR